MTRSRILGASALLIVLPLLAACGGASVTASSTSVSPSASSSETSSSTTSPTASPTETSSPSGSTTATDQPTTTGTASATNFCESFKALDGLTQGDGTPSPEQASVALKQTAANLRATAPAEIKAEVNTYASVLDTLAKSVSGTTTPAEVQKKVAESLGKLDPQAIAKVAVYAGTHCQ